MRLHHAAAAAAVTAGALAVPAGAQAATLAVQQSCAVSSLPIIVSGSGFTPNAPVTINGDAFGSATADATGSFLAQVPAPSVGQIAPKTVTLDATDGLNPANVGTATIPVVRDLFLSNAPLNGKPSSTTTWRFAGFIPGKPIYGHFRYHGKTQRNYRFGTAAGTCGTLVTKARRLPTRSHPGKWTLQLDQHKTYSKALKLKTVISFTITRRFV